MIAARHRHRLTFLVALTRLRHLVSTCTGRYKEQLPFLSSMRKGGTARSKPLDSSSRRSRTSLFNRCFRQVTVIAKETLFLKALLVFEHECLHSTTRSPVHPRQFCSHTKTLNSCLCQGCYLISSHFPSQHILSFLKKYTPHYETLTRQAPPNDRYALSRLHAAHVFGFLNGRHRWQRRQLHKCH